jgi:glutamate carboxypeptidase
MTARLSADEQRLIDHIARRRDQLVDDLRRHVALPTGRNNTPALDEARGLFTSRLAALGALVSAVPGAPRPDWLDEAPDPAPGAVPPTAVCSRLSVAGAGCRILLAGHLDTVHDPAGDFRELTVAADGRRATGPGCADMKGGLVIAVAALESLEACGVRPAFGFVLNSDEETGSFHSDHTLRAEALAYDVGLIMEPALPDGSLVIQRPGSAQFRLDARGTPAHVGRDFTSGRSAIQALAHAITAANALADPARGRIASVGVVTGGIATNVVPPAASAWGNFRYPAEPDGREIDAALHALAFAQPGLCLAVRTVLNRPAKPRMPATDLLAATAQAAARDLGQPLPLGVTGGVCDGNNLQAAGLPTIDTLGVRGGGLHTPQEWIDLDSLVERCQLLALLIARLTRQGLR